MRCDEHVCCHPQLEPGEFDCLEAPHGNWEVEGGHTDAVGNKTRVSCGALETLRMWRGTVPRRACGWGELRCGERPQSLQEKCQSKQLGFD